MIILARGIKPMANKKVTPFMVGLLACVTLTGCSESGTQLLFENEPDTKDIIQMLLCQQQNIQSSLKVSRRK